MIESPGLSDHTEFEDQTLREKSRWIRDTLDPEIAREGPSYLDDRHIVTLVKFLRDLIRARISVDQLARTRIHHAVMCIAGRATRWPKPLIQEADKIIRHWSIRYGSLHEIPGTLYEPGGRLHGVCLPQDIDKEVLEIKWLRAKDSKTIGGYARRHGDMGIEAGSLVLIQSVMVTRLTLTGGGSTPCLHTTLGCSTVVIRRGGLFMTNMGRTRCCLPIAMSMKATIHFVSCIAPSSKTRAGIGSRLVRQRRGTHSVC